MKRLSQQIRTKYQQEGLARYTGTHTHTLIIFGALKSKTMLQVFDFFVRTLTKSMVLIITQLTIEEKIINYFLYSRHADQSLEKRTDQTFG